MSNMTGAMAIKSVGLDRLAFLEASHAVSRGVASLFDCASLSFEYMDPAVEGLLGFTAEEIETGGTEFLMALVHSDDQGVIPWRNREALSCFGQESERAVLESEYRMRHKDGRWRWFHTHRTAYDHHPDGRLCRILSFSSDITARKESEEALLRSEAMLAEAQGLAGLGSFELTPHQTEKVWSEGMFRLFDRDPQLGPMSVPELLEVVYPEDRRAFQAARKMLFEDGVPLHLEHRIVWQDGSVHNLVTNAHWVVSPEGGAGRMVGAILDITDRKRSEMELRESMHRFHDLADCLPQPVFEVDRAGRLNYVNRCAITSFGYPIEELLGHHAIELLVVEDRLRAIQDLANGMNDGSPRHEFMVLRKDGTVFPVLIHASPIIKEGVPVGLRGIVVDLTESRRAQEEQERLQERLMQAEKMDAVGQLAGGIAHDFNNHLSAIMGFAGMLHERLEDPTLRRYASNILKSSQRSAELTKQLLAFARKGKYLSVPVNMHEIIEEVMQILEHSIDKRIALSAELSAQSPMIMGDPTQLENALMNMALNARDAMPNGGCLRFATQACHLDEIYCRTLPYELKPGPFLQVSVSDTGIGMDRELQKRIFDPFFTTKEVGKGTGLGMASVYGTVKHHNGAINVYSEVGRGSCFKLYFPLTDLDMGRVEASAELEPTPGNQVVLVVEDEALVGEMLTHMLEHLGHQVILLKDGQEAVEFYAEAGEFVDLVILDLVMPRLCGKDTFRELRKINPGVRVLLSSGYSVDGEAQLLFDEGALGFLQKPYKIVELGRVLSEVLSHPTA